MISFATSPLQEFILVELQGKIEFIHPDQIDSLFTLSSTSSPHPRIQIGNQQLTGTRISLDKPFGIIQRNESLNFSLCGLVREKLLFNSRPEIAATNTNQ